MVDIFLDDDPPCLLNPYPSPAPSPGPDLAFHCGLVCKPFAEIYNNILQMPNGQQKYKIKRGCSSCKDIYAAVKGMVFSSNISSSFLD